MASADHSTLENTLTQTRAITHPGRITLIYILIAAVWIIGTNALLKSLPHDLAMQLNTIKALAFASVTAAVLHFFLCRWHRSRLRMEKMLYENIASLRESQKDLSAIIENLPDIFYRTDNEGRLLRISKRSQDILGYSESEMLGRKLADFYMNPPDRDKFLATILQCGGFITRYEVPFKRKDGAVVWCSVNARLAQDDTNTIVGVEGLCRDVSDTHRMEEEMQRLARHDPLTGLLNRNAFSQNLEQSLARSRRGHSSLAVLFMDLDGFKAVNDSFGHETGDQMLCEVANRLTGELRETDQAGRFGGDEFMMLLEGRPGQEKGAMIAAERLVKLLSQAYQLGTGEHRVSASVGVALYPEDGKTADALLRNADHAMYLAKKSGKNAFRRYSPDAPSSDTH